MVVEAEADLNDGAPLPIRNFTVVFQRRLQGADRSEVLSFSSCDSSLLAAKKLNPLIPLCSAPWKSLLSQDSCWQIWVSPQAWLPVVAHQMCLLVSLLARVILVNWSYCISVAVWIRNIFSRWCQCRHLLFRKSIFMHFAGQKMAFIIHSLGQVAPSSHRGDGADASGQPPKAWCPTPDSAAASTTASPAASHQQRGSACPCRFAVKLEGSLLFCSFWESWSGA